MNGHLLKLCFFGETLTAQPVVNYILGKETGETSTLVEENINFSKLHQRIVNPKIFHSFLVQRYNTRPETILSKFVRKNLRAMELISQGMNLWARENFPEIFISFQKICILKYAALLTTTYLTEIAVKTYNHCTTNGRTEDALSLYATTNVSSRNAIKVKAMYVPTIRRKMEIVAQSLRHKIHYVELIDKVKENVKGKEESEREKKKKLK